MAALFSRSEYETAAREASEAFRARKGADAVSFTDQSVHFETWDQIWAHLRWMAANTTGITRTRVAVTTKGV